MAIRARAIFCLLFLVPLFASAQIGPKGKAITFWQYDREDPHLCAIKLADHKTNRLTAKRRVDEIAIDGPVLLSPDGKRVAFPSMKYADQAGADDGTIHIRPIDNSDAKPRSLDVKGTPICWSPDGSKLLVVDFDGASFSHMLVDVATGKSEPVTLPVIKHPNFDAPVDSYVTDWSPDGKLWLFICFFSDEREHDKASPRSVRKAASSLESQNNPSRDKCSMPS